MKGKWIIKKKKLQLSWYTVDVLEEEENPLDIEETLISVREEALVRWDIPLLVSLGLDPLVYKAEYFHDNSGNLAVFNRWWYDYNFHITNQGLIPLYDYKPGVFLPRGYAASASHTYPNCMI